jgi:hypothetical protein
VSKSGLRLCGVRRAGQCIRSGGLIIAMCIRIAAFVSPASPSNQALDTALTMTSTAGDQECRGCHHPPSEKDAVTKALSELGVLRGNSRTGCETCSIILEGVRNCVPSVESLGDEAIIRIDFNVRGRRSFEVCVLPSSKIVSFFTLEGECGGRLR